MEIHWIRSQGLASQQESAVLRLQALERLCDEIREVRITASETRHHRYGAKQVRIRCALRHGDVLASREGANLGLALHEAIHDLEYALRRHHERYRRSRRTERSLVRRGVD